MFSPAELASMTAAVAETLGDGSGLGVDTVIYRGSVTLSAQDVRIVRPGGAGNVSADGTEGAQGGLQLVGRPTLDIQARDRFTIDGVAYEVIAVDPLRQIETVAHVRMVQ